MNGPDSYQFRRISLAEYRDRQEDVTKRLTPDDLKSGFAIAEGYTTNASLAKREGALAFTAAIELLSPVSETALGAIGIKLMILHSHQHSSQENIVERLADAYPQGSERTSPLWWAITGQFSIRLPGYSNAFREGFLTHWADTDASDPGWLRHEDVPRDFRMPPLS